MLQLDNIIILMRNFPEFAPLPVWSEYVDNRIVDVFESMSTNLKFHIKYIKEPELMESLPEWFKNKNTIKLFLENTAKFNKLISGFNTKTKIVGETEDVEWSEVHGIENGKLIKIDEIEKAGLDPNFILVFRRAPLSEDYHRFWTSDYIKVRDALQREIPTQKRIHTQILVSTLAEINGEEGLIEDHTDVNIGTSFMRKGKKRFNGRLITIVRPHKFNQI